MYHNFLGPRGLQETHMDTFIKNKNSKSMTFTVRWGFFTFWAILAHSVTPLHCSALCVQMDFTRTFETKCNNINLVWNHFYKILVVLKYHICPWANIFDTDIFRCIIPTKMGVNGTSTTKIFLGLTSKILLQLVVVWIVRIKSIWTDRYPW